MREEAFDGREVCLSLHQGIKPPRPFAGSKQDTGVGSYFRSNSELLVTSKHTEDQKSGSNSTLE